MLDLDEATDGSEKDANAAPSSPQFREKQIQCFSEQELLIPEHPDITAEVDKLLQKIAEAEDKMAVMELHYDENVADKTVL